MSDMVGICVIYCVYSTDIIDCYSSKETHIKKKPIRVGKKEQNQCLKWERYDWKGN